MSTWQFFVVCVIVGVFLIVFSIPQQSSKRMVLYFCAGMIVLFLPLYPYLKDKNTEDNKCEEAGGYMLRTSGADVCVDARVVIELSG